MGVDGVEVGEAGAMFDEDEIIREHRE